MGRGLVARRLRIALNMRPPTASPTRTALPAAILNATTSLLYARRYTTGRLMVRMNFSASPWSSSVLLKRLIIVPHNQIYNYMTKILHLFRFTDDSPSKPDAEIDSDPWENKRRLRRVVIIPFRSPNDQQQVLVIRTFYTNEGSNS